MEVDSSSTPAATTKSSPVTVEPVPEIDIYLRLLIIHQLLKEGSPAAKARELSVETVKKMQALNRRSLDSIAAKVWFALERSFELGGDLAEARPLVNSYHHTLPSH